MPRDALFIPYILNALDEVKDKFRNSLAAYNESSSAGVFINTEFARFFCIEKSKQETSDFKQITINLFNVLNISSSPIILQVIGDSQRFGVDGSIFAKKFFADYIEQLNEPPVILYGFTGKTKGNGTSAF